MSSSDHVTSCKPNRCTWSGQYCRLSVQIGKCRFRLNCWPEKRAECRLVVVQRSWHGCVSFRFPFSSYSFWLVQGFGIPEASTELQMLSCGTANVRISHPYSSIPRIPRYLVYYILLGSLTLCFHVCWRLLKQCRRNDVAPMNNNYPSKITSEEM